jgi:hypothetical protein
MAVQAVGSPESGTSQLPGREATPSTGLCTLAALSPVVSILLGRAVSAEQLRDKAIGFGLLRAADAEALPALTCQAASRLLLAGYRLPAFVGPSTTGALPSAPGTRAWHVADGLLLVAAPSWGDLPREGSRFFGGARDPDGTYHWYVAECFTDGEGRILRC